MKEELIFDGSITKDDHGGVILGTLEGPCADFIDATRNGRKYPEELWEHVFEDDIVKEMFACGGIPGELDHPIDRTETCSEKIAIIMPYPPVKKNGKLWAKFHILDTPNGRIANTLAKYGFKLGISSRGNGEVVEDYNGNESVDPQTYEFNAFDLVLLPAVKEARLKYMSESLDQSNLKKSLNESLSSANEDEKRVMKETLNHLGIPYKRSYTKKPKIEENLDETPKRVTHKVDPPTDAAKNIGADIARDLQEALYQVRTLEKEKLELQEKLSVSYAKETQLNEDLSKYKSMVIKLSDNAKQLKALKNQVDSLKEQLQKKSKIIDAQEVRITRLVENQKSRDSKNQSLNESLALKESQNKKLKESLDVQKAAFERTQIQLKESLEDLKKDMAIKVKDNKLKLDRANSLAEQYRNIAKTAVDKYIESEAIKLGVKPQDIKKHLSENYSFKEIDSVCQELRSYQINLNSLPFNLKSTPIKKISIKESVEPIRPKSNYDDDIDDQLMVLTNKLL